MLCYVIMLLITSKHICRKKLSRWLLYPRVTSFDAIKQSTGICAHAIPRSSNTRSFQKRTQGVLCIVQGRQVLLIEIALTHSGINI